MKVLGSISDRKGTCKWLNGSQEGKGGILQTGDSALVQFFKKIKKKKLYGCTCGIWKFLGQGLNLSCSFRNAGSFNPLRWARDQTRASEVT